MKTIKFSSILTAIAIGCLLLTGCTAQIGTLSIASANTTSLQYKEGAKGTQVIGKGGTLDAAFKNALSKTGSSDYDALIDCRVDAIFHYVIIYSWYTYRVTGTPVKTSMIKN